MIFIDTQLWIYAQKEPDPNRFPTKVEYERMLGFHQKADSFLQRQVKQSVIAMTYHQLAEIYHDLAFQGQRIDNDFCAQFCSTMLRSRFMKWFPMTETHIQESLRLSTKSGIHVWDYLCILPVIQNVDVLYTCDSHFQHETFTSFQRPIHNPVGEWIAI
ncbi:MAG: hypothetical protein Q6373_018865 [Candidatus Sigynarchaeota archaeon]